jgi:predicted TIM-barrel fold metal-dependent hydrolase
MSTHTQTEARALRGRLKHPIIDADGHWAEFHPLMRQEFHRIGGDMAVEALDMASARIPNSLNMSVAERRRRRIGQEAFWFLPTKNTLDRATAMMPRLLYERLDDLGLDFCVIYPTAGLGYYRLPPEKHRRALCRAYNVFTAEQFRPYGDRIIPAAIIPMYSPEEAIEELEFASKQLGLRVVMLGSLIRRPIPRSSRSIPMPRSSSSGTT